MLRQFIASISLVGAAGTAASAPPLDWIGGHWCADVGGETVEEFWLPPHGGVVIGMSRTLSDGRTAGFEYVRIVDVDGAASYIAQPGGRAPTTFKQTAGGERWIRFENPGHDFPQRVEYRRDGDTLQAEIAGPGEDGTETAIAFDYRRCDPQAFQSNLLLTDGHRSGVIATTDRFELHSNPRVSLHHFLIAWAAADHDEWPPYAVPIAERGSWRAVLDADEERAWSAAAEAYAATRGRNVVFDQGLIAVRGWAAGAAPRESIPASDQPLADAVDSVLPLYDKHWWPAHDARTRAWIASLEPALREIENDVPARLESAYGGRWPDAPIPVDVIAYCNPVGAYSTAGRVTISSADYGNAMPQALEMMFHEASHVDTLQYPLERLVREAFRAAGGEAPERFWHDMIFFTAGAATRIALAAHGQPGYRHYGDFGVYRRGERWAAQLPVLEQHWLPFLESGAADADARRAALQAVAAGLATDPPPAARGRHMLPAAVDNP